MTIVHIQLEAHRPEQYPPGGLATIEGTIYFILHRIPGGICAEPWDQERHMEYRPVETPIVTDQQQRGAMEGLRAAHRQYREEQRRQHVLGAYDDIVQNRPRMVTGQMRFTAGIREDHMRRLGYEYFVGTDTWERPRTMQEEPPTTPLYRRLVGDQDWTDDTMARLPYEYAETRRRRVRQATFIPNEYIPNE